MYFFVKQDFKNMILLHSNCFILVEKIYKILIFNILNLLLANLLR